MIKWILQKIVGNKNQREVRRIRPVVARINEIEEALQREPEEKLYKIRNITTSTITICIIASLVINSCNPKEQSIESSDLPDDDVIAYNIKLLFEQSTGKGELAIRLSTQQRALETTLIGDNTKIVNIEMIGKHQMEPRQAYTVYCTLFLKFDSDDNENNITPLSTSGVYLYKLDNKKWIIEIDKSLIWPDLHGTFWRILTKIE